MELDPFRQEVSLPEPYSALVLLRRDLLKFYGIFDIVRKNYFLGVFLCTITRENVHVTY